ncbi:MAG: hypothetical protein ACAI35_24630 [Candidatus Methylacidiphilales bacterium]
MVVGDLKCGVHAHRLHAIEFLGKRIAHPQEGIKLHERGDAFGVDGVKIDALMPGDLCRVDQLREPQVAMAQIAERLGAQSVDKGGRRRFVPGFVLVVLQHHRAVVAQLLLLHHGGYGGVGVDPGLLDIGNESFVQPSQLVIGGGGLPVVGPDRFGTVFFQVNPAGNVADPVGDAFSKGGAVIVKDADGHQGVDDTELAVAVGKAPVQRGQKGGVQHLGEFRDVLFRPLRVSGTDQLGALR